MQSITATAPGSSQVLLQHGPAGSTVTVTGSGFSPGAFCTLHVGVGSQSVSNPQTDGSHISFTTAAGWNGQVTVTLDDGHGGTITDNHLIYVTDPPPTSGLDNPRAPEGAAVSLVGQGFNFGVPGTATWASYYWTTGSSGPCTGATGNAPGVSQDGTHISLQIPTQYCDGAVDVFLAVPLAAGHTCTPNDNACNTFRLSAAFDPSPQPTGMSRTSGTPGQTVVVTGNGFSNLGGSAALNGTAAHVQSWSDTSISVVIPASATGGTLTLARSVDNQQFSPGSVGVNAVVSGVSPAQGVVGDSITINGSGFGTQAGSLSLAGTAPNVQQWTPTSIVFTVPDGVPPGPTTITINTNGTAAPAPPAFNVLPHITGITPTHSAPGSLIEIDGVSFGTQQGSVQFGGVDGSITLWGDKSVLVMVPAAASPGQTTVALTPPNSDAATSAYTIDAPPPSSSGQPGGGGGNGHNNNAGGSTAGVVAGTPGATAQATPGLILPNPAGPVIARGPVAFVKPTPPPGPVSLRLDTGASQADPGGSVPFTVTLIAFGKPVSGAPVDLLLVIEPGSDASLDPAHAVTDAQGQVKGTIHLSRTAGDHIVLARSGIYSDEVRVVGRSATTASAAGRSVGGDSGGSTASSLVSVRSPVLWALLACVLLFGAGFALNLATAPVGGASAAGAVDARTEARQTLRRVTEGAGAALRFGAGVVAVVGAQALGALRRR